MTKQYAIYPHLSLSWMLFKAHIPLFAGIMLTLLASWVVLEIVVIVGQQFGLVWWAIAHLLFFITFAGLEAGFIHICLELEAGQEPTYQQLFSHLHLGISFLVGQIIYYLIVLGGLLLFLVPGIYAGTRYTLFRFAMVNHSLPLTDSFQHSTILTAGQTSPLFRFLLFLLCFNIIGASFLGIGLFITLPISTLMKAKIYRQLTI